MTRPTVPAFTGNISFNAQHSPMGAFMSFTCGHFGTRGGIGVQIGKPANQDLYIGVKEGDRFSDTPLKCLPFFKPRGGPSAAADFQVEQAGPAEQNAAPKVIAYAKDQITRRYGWATDTWETPDCVFKVYTPFGGIPDPAQGELQAYGRSIRPAISAELELDNSAGTSSKTLVFAIGFDTPGARLLTALPGSVAGFAHRRDVGAVGRVRRSRIVNGKPIVSTQSPDAIQRFNVTEAIAHQTPHPLGATVGLIVTVPAGEKAILELAIGCYLDGIVTTGLEGRFAYTRHYASLEQVLLSQLESPVTPECDRLDAELLNSGLTADQQFLIAHATRSYYGSTQLLDVGGEPFWIVNEGEYCMMNTLDLSVDQVFWELKHNPWIVRNLLDNFVRHYSYVDQVKGERRSDAATERRSEGTSLLPGGISFAHDMGAHNNFSPPGHSSYELPDLTGCFSYMTAEQLCNWILVAATYVARAGDLVWLQQNRRVLEAAQKSLENRGGACGYISRDSSRCASGSEITTYDSLDHSLAQARESLYMAVKSWAAYGALAEIFRKFDDGDAHVSSDLAGTRQVDIEGAMLKLRRTDGTWPAIFDETSPGYQSRILPAIEGLLYVHECRALRSIDDHLWYDALKRHTLELLTDPERRNLFPDGGIKLSSTSNNSWMSKIAIFQHVAREVFHLDDDPAIRKLFADADAAHVKWQTDGSGYWACSDQFVSGVAKGSRYYPRIITVALWLDGRAARKQ